jgi:energy-coupling factor transporter transmembrane protein EcfT
VPVTIKMTLKTIYTLAIVAAILVAGFFLGRHVFKFAWKLIRVALIIIAILIVVGYLTGFLDIIIR